MSQAVVSFSLCAADWRGWVGGLQCVVLFCHSDCTVMVVVCKAAAEINSPYILLLTERPSTSTLAVSATSPTNIKTESKDMVFVPRRCLSAANLSSYLEPESYPPHLSTRPTQTTVFCFVCWVLMSCGSPPPPSPWCKLSATPGPSTLTQLLSQEVRPCGWFWPVPSFWVLVQACDFLRML